MKQKLSAHELAGLTVAQLFPKPSTSIFGDWDGIINSVVQAENILEISDISREVGLRLSPEDEVVERYAYFMVKNNRRKK